jgi:hypothetical protein
VTKQCTMYSAPLLYPVALENNIITLRTSAPLSVEHIQHVGTPSDYFAYYNSTGSLLGTLAGVTVAAAQNMFYSEAGQDAELIATNGLLATQYVDFGTGNFSYFATQDLCTMNWRDPTVNVVNALNEVMFRTAVTASNISRYAFMNLDD